MLKNQTLHLMIGVSVIVLAISGCAPKEIIIKEKDVDSPIAKSISGSAVEIHKDLQQLTKLKELNPHTFQPKKTPTTGPLATKMTLKWVGRPEEIVKTISSIILFVPPKLIGKSPVNAPSVTVNAIDKPVAEILEDIGLQMGSDAGIAIGANQITVIFEGAH